MRLSSQLLRGRRIQVGAQLLLPKHGPIVQGSRTDHLSFVWCFRCVEGQREHVGCGLFLRLSVCRFVVFVCCFRSIYCRISRCLLLSVKLPHRVRVPTTTTREIETLSLIAGPPPPACAAGAAAPPTVGQRQAVLVVRDECALMVERCMLHALACPWL